MPERRQQRPTVIIGREPSVRTLAFFVITSGEYAGVTLKLGEGTTRIGRDGLLNEHAIDDEAVSVQHISVRYQDGQFFLTDLDTSNGTFVNGREVHRYALQSNDAVVIGRTRLVFLQVGEPPRTAGPARATADPPTVPVDISEIQSGRRS